MVYVPPLVAGIALVFLLINLDESNWLDANAWPHYFSWPLRLVEKGNSLSQSGMGIYRVLVATTAFLVLLNNAVLYIWDILEAMENANSRYKWGKLARRWSFLLGIGATLLVVFWITDTVVSFLPAEFEKKHEVMGCLVFTSFAAIDRLLATNARARLRERLGTEEAAVLEAQGDYYGDQAAFADAPVVVGMVALFVLGSILGNYPDFFSVRFALGFISGAIGMHLAYSQFVFFGLTVRYRKRLNLARLDAKAERAPTTGEHRKPRTPTRNR